jgi:formate hydrogenlyase subunit 4
VTYHLLLVAVINLLIAVALAPLFEGVIRKLKAIVHSRKGPPITQPYLDLLKLLGKEDLRVTTSLVYRLAPMLALASIMVVALLTPMGLGAPLGFTGDFIVLLYFAAFSAVAIMLSGFASGNPYAYLGAAREMMLLLTVEPVMAVALVVAALKSGSLGLDNLVNWQLAHGPSVSMVVAGIAFLLALQAQAAKLPFDVAEADQEIMGGPFIEQGGPRLALFKLTCWAKQLVFSFLLVQVFVPWPRLGLPAADLAVTAVKVLVVVVLIGLVDVVNPRLRIDQSMNYYARVVFVSLAALAFAVVGA